MDGVMYAECVVESGFGSCVGGEAILVGEEIGC